MDQRVRVEKPIPPFFFFIEKSTVVGTRETLAVTLNAKKERDKWRN